MMEEIDLRIDLDTALHLLTDKQREAVVLWSQGYTQAEIGKMVGISQRAAGRRIKRAIRTLKQMF